MTTFTREDLLQKVDQMKPYFEETQRVIYDMAENAINLFAGVYFTESDKDYWLIDIHGKTMNSFYRFPKERYETPCKVTQYSVDLRDKKTGLVTPIYSSLTYKDGKSETLNLLGLEPKTAVSSKGSMNHPAICIAVNTRTASGYNMKHIKCSHIVMAMRIGVIAALTLGNNRVLEVGYKEKPSDIAKENWDASISNLVLQPKSNFADFEHIIEKLQERQRQRDSVQSNSAIETD